jgi:hypothetical protein
MAKGLMPLKAFWYQVDSQVTMKSMANH